MTAALPLRVGLVSVAASARSPSGRRGRHGAVFRAVHTTGPGVQAMPTGVQTGSSPTFRHSRQPSVQARHPVSVSPWASTGRSVRSGSGFGESAEAGGGTAASIDIRAKIIAVRMAAA